MFNNNEIKKLRMRDELIIEGLEIISDILASHTLKIAELLKEIDVLKNKSKKK